LEQAGDDQVIVESDPYSAFQPTYTIDVWESMDGLGLPRERATFPLQALFLPRVVGKVQDREA